MLVHIKKDSIRENPRAGQTTTEVVGGWEGTFTMKRTGDKSINAGIEEFGMMPGIVFTSWNDDLAEGLAELPEALYTLNYKASLSKDFNVDIKQNTERHTFEHAPMPKYLYSYEDALIQCNECSSKVLVSSIRYDSYDDEAPFSVCPDCNAHDSFESIEYENINDVIK